MGGNAVELSSSSWDGPDPQSPDPGMAPRGGPPGTGLWLDGNVHRVTFHNKSNGYSVLSIEVVSPHPPPLWVPPGGPKSKALVPAPFITLPQLFEPDLLIP